MSSATEHQSAERDQHLHIAYLGPEASFSHQAALALFPPARPASGPTATATETETYDNVPEITLHPLPSFSAIFSSLQNQPPSQNPPRPGASSTSSSSSSSALPLHTSQTPSSTTTATTATPPPPTTAATSSPQYDYGVIPIENSTNGSVVQVLDLLAQSGPSTTTHESQYPDLQVCAEYYLPVHHCLFVKPTSPPSSASASTLTSTLSPSDEFHNITTLYTHPQVWGQCARFLSRHFPAPRVERIDVGSTSAAAALVAKTSPIGQPGQANGQANGPGPGSGPGQGGSAATAAVVAAISSRLAGDKYGLTCLAENIEDEVGLNTTRFLVVRNRRGKTATRTSVETDSTKEPGGQVATQQGQDGSFSSSSSSSSSSSLLSSWKSRYHVDLVSRRQQRSQGHAQAQKDTTTTETKPTKPPTPSSSTSSSSSSSSRHKSLITFTIAHTKPGALADALAVFKRHGFNLTSIDTRPSRRRNWEYVFFVECEEADGADGVNSADSADSVGEGKRVEDLPRARKEDGGIVDGEERQGEGDKTDDDDDDDDDDIPDQLRRILRDLKEYTESLRYLGRFVDQLQD